MLRKIITQPFKSLSEFIKLESASGMVLFLMTLLALAISNSSWQPFYQTYFSQLLLFNKSLNFWINDALMTLFFLLVGLEIKRELISGQLDTLQKRILPGVAALGGICIPALIFTLINWHEPTNLRGWAIPAATDIAFALAILSLLGKRVPVGLKIFLMALAIIDDVGAVIIITVFYTAQLSWFYLSLAASCLLVLGYANYKQCVYLGLYLIGGLLLWYCVLQSGIHPTIAGVLLAFCIPLRAKKNSPSRRLEHYLHPWVAFGIMPLFAFTNAGISFANTGWQDIVAGIPLGIIGGLFLGKQLGIIIASWIVIKLGWARLPGQVNWKMFYGVAVLCGVGFTMSLFIGNLAYQGLHHSYGDQLRLGVLLGSAVSGLLGFIILYTTGKLEET